MTRIVPNVFWMAKDERAPGEWEDAGAFDMKGARFAVADGASAAYRAREWATQLVTCYVTAPPALDADEEVALRWFAESANDWRTTGGGAPLEWYHQDAERRGSFAAFVGAGFFASAGRLRWHAIAVGDCCLFHLRDDVLTTAFPLSDPSEFGHSPDLVPSAIRNLEGLRHKVRIRSGQAVPGDLFVLCSDALAKFLLEEAPYGESAWAAIRSIGDNDDFARFIRYLRNENAIALDDVTLLRLVVRAD